MRCFEFFHRLSELAQKFSDRVRLRLDASGFVRRSFDQASNIFSVLPMRLRSFRDRELQLRQQPQQLRLLVVRNMPSRFNGRLDLFDLFVLHAAAGSAALYIKRVGRIQEAWIATRTQSLMIVILSATFSPAVFM